MKVYNQVEPQLNSAERPAGLDAGTAGRRPLYHPAAVPRIGRVLRERYRLESLLGMGAMGEVYRATDLRLQQPCAVKLVFPGAVFGLKAHRRFVNEARVVARLFHPNIVEVRDFSEDEDGTKFLVMELLEGQDLHEVLSRQGRLPLPRAMEIIRAVGAALQYAHDMGIVHRDVKPENIFLASRGQEQVKVLDFGLAKLLRDPDDDASRDDPAGATAAQLTKGIIIGTMAYLSPEATGMDSRQVDARADQWSLAVVAYQLLSGRLPFGNPNPLGLWQMICTEEPQRLRSLLPMIPEHIDRAIHIALAKDRKDRFPRITDFIRSLGNLPQLGSVETARPAGSAAGKSGVAAPLPKGVEGLASIPRDQIPPEPSEPTEVEPYLPGLTRPRLALLPSVGPGGRGVPEFVEPEAALRTLRVASGQGDAANPLLRTEPGVPHPDLLVTAHYTAEQLIELSRMASMGEAPALVHAAQDVPTAPYRLGARVIKDMDEQFDRTPLPVPRPLGGEPSVRVQAAVVARPKTQPCSTDLARAELVGAEANKPPGDRGKGGSTTMAPGGELSGGAALLTATLVPSGDAPAAPARAASATPVPSGDEPIQSAGAASEPRSATLLPSRESSRKAAAPMCDQLCTTFVPGGESPIKTATLTSEQLCTTFVPGGESPIKTVALVSEPLRTTFVPGGASPAKTSTLVREPLYSTFVPDGQPLSKTATVMSESPRTTFAPEDVARKGAASERVASVETVPVPTRPPPSRPSAAAHPAASRPTPRAQPPRPPAAALTAPLRSPAQPPVPPALPLLARSAVKSPLSLAGLPPLPMPSLLTLPGTTPPELGRPLTLRSPEVRRSLWRAVGAGSVVLGLLIAVLLGLRMARAKAVPPSPAPQSDVDQPADEVPVSADQPSLDTPVAALPQLSLNQLGAKLGEGHLEVQSLAASALPVIVPSLPPLIARPPLAGGRSVVKLPGPLQPGVATVVPPAAPLFPRQPAAALPRPALPESFREPASEVASEQLGHESIIPESGPAAVGSLSD